MPRKTKAAPKPPPPTPVQQYAPIASLALVAIGVAVVTNYLVAWRAPEQSTLPDSVLPPALLGRTMPRSNPARLQIPAINVDTSFVELGLDDKNEIEVPDSYTEVGWYTLGPTPGEQGPAIVLGHVDSHLGPAVFFSLGQLEPGDTLDITREDGTVATFRVDKLERYAQKDFPTDRVYGDLDHAGLRLITCSGSYDRESRRYDANLIVYASLVDIPPVDLPAATTGSEAS